MFLSGRRKPCFQPVKVLKIIGCPLIPVLPVRVRPGDIKTCSKRARDGLGKYTAQTFLLAQAASNSIFPPLCGIAIAKFLAGWLPSGVRRIPRLSSSTRPLWGSTSRHMVGLLAGAFVELGQKMDRSYGLHYAAVHGAPPSLSSTPRLPSTLCRPPTRPPASRTPTSSATHRSHHVLPSFPPVLLPYAPWPAAAATADATRSTRVQSSHTISLSASPAGWLRPASHTARAA